MKKYKLKVKVKNKVFNIKGTPIRTPFVIDNLSEKELDFYFNKLRLEGVLENDYEIEELTESSKPKFNNINPRSRKLDIVEDNDVSTENSILDEIIDSVE